MKTHLFYYRALVKYVYDGDTITTDIDLGMHAWIHDEKIRLSQINTPKLKGDEREKGLKSRDYLADHGTPQRHTGGSGQTSHHI